MRRRSLATLFLATMVLTAPGCRQTTATIPGGPAPVGSLAPVSPGQAPLLGPFGGNTKVTPPATGSYQPTGGYIGASTTPDAQPYFGITQAGAATGTGSNGPAAGVQVAGWNETNSVVPETPGVASTFGTNPSATSDPRSGGMRVIDMTAAPAPPGYRPSALPVGPVYAAPPNQSNLVPLTPNAPIVAQPQSEWQQPTGTLQTAPFQASPAVSPIRAATTAQGPSTEPIDQGTGSGDLNWRRPGSQF